MSHVVDATYENGVLKLLRPLPLKACGVNPGLVLRWLRILDGVALETIRTGTRTTTTRVVKSTKVVDRFASTMTCDNH